MREYILSPILWSASLGLIGTILIFIFGLPPSIAEKGVQYLALEQEDPSEKKKWRLYKILSYVGIGMIALSFIIQGLEVFTKK